jgi:hypothetical protein
MVFGCLKSTPRFHKKMAKGLKNVMHHENIPVLDQITCYLRPSPAFHSCKLGARFFDVMINMVDGLNHDDTKRFSYFSRYVVLQIAF